MGQNSPGLSNVISTAVYCGLLFITNLSVSIANPVNDPAAIEQSVTALLAEMTLAEKVGQMNQLNASDSEINDQLRESIAAGRVGSVLNQVDVDAINELQRIAVQESRLGIPLLVGRDVIHGFKTIMPIPLGQAATWNPEIARR